jgi:hypothetical protein
VTANKKAMPLRHGRRSTRRACVVRGCANQTRPGAIICDIHAEALRPPPGGEAA